MQSSSVLSTPMHGAGRSLARGIAILEGRYWPYAFLLPSVLLMIGIVAYPIAWGLGLSVREMRLTRPDLGTGFVGLTHYIDIASDPIFWLSLKNTLMWVAGATIGELMLGLGAALLLNRSLVGFKVLGVILLLPWMLPNVVAADMWALMLDSRIGILNHGLVATGLLGEYKAWFADPATALWAAMFVEIWHGFPFFYLLLFAGIQGISVDYYEAARCDGANGLQQFYHVTLPMLKTLIVATVVLRVISLMNSPDILLVLTSGGPAYSTEVLSLYAFQKATLEFDFGYAAALSTVMFMILMAFSYLYVRYNQVIER
jgi:multiple sugar transport system permease protein